MKAVNLGENPVLDAKDPDLPVGLKVRSRYLALDIIMNTMLS